MKFSGKTAIVTGAANGIGFEIARQLLTGGANVILNDINPAAAHECSTLLSAEGPGRCIAVPGDAGEIDCIKEMVAQAVRSFGRVDMAVANASHTLFSNFFDFEVEDFEKIINLNLRGSYFLAQRAARQMRKQQSGGRIVLISSTIGFRAYPMLSVYSMSKAALHMMAKSLVLDLSCHDITINAVAPGATITDRTRLEDPQYEKKWSELIPDGKAAYPSDIAKATLFFLSDDAAHITGQTLVVDGGWMASGQNPDAENIKNTEDIKTV